MSGQIENSKKPVEEVIDLTEEPVDEMVMVGPWPVTKVKKKPAYYECSDDYSAFDDNLESNSSS
jgi:hypothetical protein